MNRHNLDRYILAIGLSLRMFGLAHGSLWHDEAFTGLLAPLPWHRFWEAMIGDVHPPGWYLISRPFVALLGNRVVSLRLPAMICSVLALWLFWRLVVHLADRRPLPWTYIAALALMAVSPLQVYYAQEARMYGAVTLCSVMMLYAVIFDRPWLFGAGAVGVLWLHNLGAIYVLAGVIAVALHRRYALSMGRWWGPGFVSLILASPALAITAMQLREVAGGYWIVDKSVGAWLYNTFFCSIAGQGVIDSRLSWNAALICLFLGLGGLLVGVRRRRWVWVLMAWLPGLIMLALSNLVRPLLLARTLIGSTPALYLLAGQLFDTRRRRWALALCLAPVLVVGLSRHYILERRGDVVDLIDEIQAEAPEVVMHSQTGGWILMAWHMPEQRHVLWHGAYSGLSNAVSARTAAALGMERAELQDLPRPAAIIFADYALISPEERHGMITELEASGAELTYVLADDPYQRVDLWMLR